MYDNHVAVICNEQPNGSKHIPAILKGLYELVFKFDTESLLNYYKGIFTKVGLERITGINQRQIQHYSSASGLKKPRPTQVKKIESALHKPGYQLLSCSALIPPDHWPGDCWSGDQQWRA